MGAVIGNGLWRWEMRAPVVSASSGSLLARQEDFEVSATIDMAPVLTAREGHDGEIFVVTLNRPRVLNAIDGALLALFEEALTTATGDHTVRCILIQSAGERAFSAGADLKVVERLTPETAKEWVRTGHRVFNQIVLCPVPTVVAIRGFALGGGLELALACDFRIAGESAQFGFPEATRGWLPGWGGTRRVCALAGPAVARAMVLSGVWLQANDAWSLRIVNRVVPDAELGDAARDLARQLSPLERSVVRLAKQQICPPGLLIQRADVEEDAEFLAAVVAKFQSPRITESETRQG